ncbi:MAG: hypothetical protein AAGI53_05720 [Planctomycetota bacterium]
MLIPHLAFAVAVMIQPDSDVPNFQICFDDDFDLDREIAWRRVEMDRWMFEPIFLDDDDTKPAAVLVWRTRDRDASFTGLGGHDYTAMLYLFDDRAKGLPVEHFAEIDAWPELPVTVAWTEDAQWAHDILPLVFVMGLHNLEDYTDIPSGFYMLPGATPQAPDIGTFPITGDPILNANQGDHKAALRTLDQFMTLLNVRGGKPDVGSFGDRRLDAVRAEFHEIFPPRDWTLEERTAPVDNECTCRYGQRFESLETLAYFDGSLDDSVDAAARARILAEYAKPRTRTDLRISQFNHTVPADQPCPDAATVEDLKAERAHQASLNDQTDPEPKPRPIPEGGTGSHGFGAWRFSPISAPDKTIVAFLAELDPTSATGDNITMVYIGRDAAGQTWTHAAWPANADRNRAAAWLKAKHGQDCLRYRDRWTLGKFQSTNLEPIAPTPMVHSFFASDPSLDELTDRVADPTRMRELARSGHPMAPGFEHLTSGVIPIGGYLGLRLEDESWARMFGQGSTAQTPLTIDTFANYMRWVLTPATPPAHTDPKPTP